MVPTTWLSILFFLLLVAPGLLFDLRSERRRVGVNESTFREISRVVLASLAFSSVSSLLIVLINVGLRSIGTFSLGPVQAVDHGGDYARAHPLALSLAVTAEVVIALSGAWATDVVLAQKTGASLRAQSSWVKVLRHDLPAGYIPHVRIRLSNGLVYIGRVGSYTADMEVADREIVLVPPLFHQEGSDPLTPFPTEWQRLVISGTAIETMAVQYRPPPATS